MLTRTALRSSSIEVLRTNRPEARRLLNELGEYGILMVPQGFLREAPERFPHSVWITLFELIKSGELAHRTTVEEHIEATSASPPWSPDGRIEVILDEDRAGAPLAVDCVPVVSFPEAFCVERRKNLRNKSEWCANRDELWTWVLEPLLDGLFKSRRVVTICDSYLSKHIVGIDLRRNPTWRGLAWLLDRLEANSASQGLSTEIRLVGRERDIDGTLIELSTVESKLNDIARRLNLEHLKIEVLLVPNSAFEGHADLSRAFHDRFLLFGNRRAITLGSGLDNLTQQKGDIARSTLSMAWNYATAYGMVVGELLVRLRKLSGPQSSFTVDLAAER